MDPISIGLEVVGLGMSLWGQSKQSDLAQQQAAIAKQQAQVSAGIAGDEQQINVQKQQQMQLEARRSQLQNFRNAQKMRAQATAAAVNQGALFGSGLQGGLSGVTATANENSLGINQGVEISKNIFGINSDISSKKQQLAMLGGQSSALSGQSAEAQGWTSLGGSIMKAGPIIGGFGKDLGAGVSSAMNLFSPGSLSGGFGRT